MPINVKWLDVGTTTGLSAPAFGSSSTATLMSYPSIPSSEFTALPLGAIAVVGTVSPSPSSGVTGPTLNLQFTGSIGGGVAINSAELIASGVYMGVSNVSSSPAMGNGVFASGGTVTAQVTNAFDAVSYTVSVAAIACIFDKDIGTPSTFPFLFSTGTNSPQTFGSAPSHTITRSSVTGSGSPGRRGRDPYWSLWTSALASTGGSYSQVPTYNNLSNLGTWIDVGSVKQGGNQVALALFDRDASGTTTYDIEVDNVPNTSGGTQLYLTYVDVIPPTISRGFAMVIG